MDGSKFAMIDECKWKSDSSMDCKVRYGDMIDGGLINSKTFDAKGKLMETMCWNYA
jgi:hypothetical protein